MKRTLVEIYTLVICFGAVTCFSIWLGFGAYSFVGILSPETTLDSWTYNRHQSNDQFMVKTPPFLEFDSFNENRNTKNKTQMTEPALTKSRIVSYERELKNEIRNNKQNFLKAAIVIVMAVFWIFEVVPIAITSLFPIFLFPLFGILDTKSTALFFGKEIIFLFLGGLMLAQGIKNSNLHKRIALNIILWVGSSLNRIILGCMIATASLSMFISNTATSVMMLPIAIAIVSQIKEGKKDNAANPANQT